MPVSHTPWPPPHSAESMTSSAIVESWLRHLPKAPEVKSLTELATHLPRYLQLATRLPRDPPCMERADNLKRVASPELTDAVNKATIALLKEEEAENQKQSPCDVDVDVGVDVDIFARICDLPASDMERADNGWTVKSESLSSDIMTYAGSIAPMRRVVAMQTVGKGSWNSRTGEQTSRNWIIALKPADAQVSALVFRVGTGRFRF